MEKCMKRRDFLKRSILATSGLSLSSEINMANALASPKAKSINTGSAANKNIVFISADQRGAPFLGCYGSGVNSTPALMSLREMAHCFKNVMPPAQSVLRIELHGSLADHPSYTG